MLYNQGIMILPIANIVSGFVLSAPKLKEWFSKGEEDITKVEKAISKFSTHIGVVILILGVVGLLKRASLFGIMYDWNWHFGSSYPQAIIAILMGLLLCANFFAKWPAFHSKIVELRKYSEWIGILGILIGAGSLI